MGIFAEPPPTKVDLRFSVARIPVRVHPFFWLSTLGLALRLHGLLEIGLWVAAVFVSILIHELGHAFAFRRYGCEPRITLYGFGGLASAEIRGAARSSRRARILIAAAGPLAGFAFAAVLITGVLALGFKVPLAIVGSFGSGAPITSFPLFVLVAHLMFINVIWGLVNLLPVHPLDGGEIALELARARNPARGVAQSIWVSVFTAAAAAMGGLVLLQDLFTAILFGYLAFMNVQVLRRRYDVSFESLRVVRWARSRWRRLRAHHHAAKELRAVERRDAEAPNAEVDRVTTHLFDSLAKELHKKSRGKK